MPQNQNHLVWIDLEMTGLEPEKDRIIEIAVVVTDSTLQRVADGPVLAIRQSEDILGGMDQWNQSTHKRSGLVDRVRSSSLSEADAEAQVLAFVREHVPQRTSPMCGNSVCQDRRFLARWMPQLEAWFHYRNLDVSTLKELARRWRPEMAKGFTKQSKHQALADIEESIAELAYYREHFLKV